MRAWGVKGERWTLGFTPCPRAFTMFNNNTMLEDVAMPLVAALGTLVMILGLLIMDAALLWTNWSAALQTPSRLTCSALFSLGATLFIVVFLATLLEMPGFLACAMIMHASFLVALQGSFDSRPFVWFFNIMLLFAVVAVLLSSDHAKVVLSLRVFSSFCAAGWSAVRACLLPAWKVDVFISVAAFG